MSFSSICTFNNFINIANKYIYLFPSLDPSLVLYYPLDFSTNENGTLQTPNFAKKNALYDATLFGNATITTETTKFITGYGDLSLNNSMGSNATDYVMSNNSFTLVPSQGLSISCWFSCSGELNTKGTLISLYENSNKIEIDISGTNMLYSDYNSYTYTNEFQNEHFHHVVLSISDSVYSLYLDGIQVSQNLSGNVISSNVTNAIIGASNDLSNAFRGNIGDVRVYNYTINSTQVSHLYLDRNLVNYYKFDTLNLRNIPNYATLVYDASLVSTAIIQNNTLYLNNTIDLSTSQYVHAVPTNIPPITSGLTISCWVNTTGIPNRVMSIFDITNTIGSPGISVDIYGTNRISTNYI